MALIGKSFAPRVHWDAALGWVVDTRIPLGPRALQACVDFTMRMQIDRLRAMSPGDKRRQMAEALKSLSVQTLKVNLLTRDPIGDERILY